VLIAALCEQSAFAGCRSPAYRVGQRVEESKDLVALTVSIRPADFTRERLVCLARAFRRKYANSADIEIFVFSSPDAARDYTVVRGDEAPPVYRNYDAYANMLRQLHAEYRYSATNSEEHVVLKPVGSDRGGRYDTRIDLPVSTMPSCDKSVNGRCLVALDEIVYPTESLLARETARVQLSATIAKDGSVRDVRVVDEADVPTAGRAALVREAVEDLKTWRFEAGPHADRFQITYSYEIVGRIPPGGGQVEVQLLLPERVILRGGVELR